MLRVREIQRPTTAARQKMVVIIAFRQCKNTEEGVRPVFIGQAEKKPYTLKFFSF
jgi:hypothetical protein